MPLPLEKEVVIPNVLYPPQILIQTFIVDGRAVTSINLVLKGARLEDGVWSNALSETASVSIPDISQLEPEIQPLGTSINQVMQSILTLIGQFNSIKKLM